MFVKVKLIPHHGASVVHYVMAKMNDVEYVWRKQKQNKNTEEKEEEKTNKHTGRGVRVFFNIAELFSRVRKDDKIKKQKNNKAKQK